MRGACGHRSRKATACGIILAVLAGLVFAFGLSAAPAAAETPPPSGPDRVAVVIVDYISREWWLARWKDNKVLCQIFTDHEGLPTGGEVYQACGEDIYETWSATPPCEAIEEGNASSGCPGYYLHFIKSAPAQRKIGVTLPPPVVWVSLEGCAPRSSTHFCENQPVLVLSAEEPLPNETITGIAGTFNGEAFTCGATCRFPLEATGEMVLRDGGKVYVGEAPLAVDFWAYSSYGDSSLSFQAQVLVAQKENAAAEPGWYVNVLSPQWAGAPQAGCSQTWEAFPPLSGLPAWLDTPENPEDLATNIPYDYLAGHLIAQGVVDASGCPDNGLLPGGAASTCGQEAARPAVGVWQNRFDALILAAAREAEVPAQLLKNLFSRESQFWPGVITASAIEVGLGQLTDNGADTALLWNPSFYEQFCPLVLLDSVCRKGYAQLKPGEQATLRGALVGSADAFCADCPLGLDLRRADLSVSVFAETLQANCGQVGQVIYNYLWATPGEVSSYEDLWKFTLVNYNAGPGCFALALEGTYDAGEPLDWAHLSQHLTPVCQGAIDYVEDISR
jgi:hypothetical protein